MNLYAYVNNSPLNATDPSGQFELKPLSSRWEDEGRLEEAEELKAIYGAYLAFGGEEDKKYANRPAADQPACQDTTTDLLRELPKRVERNRGGKLQRLKLKRVGVGELGPGSYKHNAVAIMATEGGKEKPVAVLDPIKSYGIFGIGGQCLRRDWTQGLKDYDEWKNAKQAHYGKGAGLSTANLVKGSDY